MSLPSAVLYLSAASLRNRVRLQLRRARSPRSIVALVAGITYFWWFLVRPAHQGGAAAILDARWTPLIGALVLAAMVTKWWVAGADERALAFAPAELHLLFPAPVTRRGLVHYKLLRAQMLVLVNTVLWSVLLRGEGTHLGAWRRALAVWLLFSTLYLHRLAAALVSASVTKHGAAGWRRHAVPLAVLVLATVALTWGLLQQSEPLGAAWSAGLRPFGRALGIALDAPLPAAVLWPFRALLAPAIATDTTTWLRALGPALVLLAAHYVWVVRTDVTFEEAALEASERRAGARSPDAHDGDGHATTIGRPVRAGRWSPAIPERGPAVVAIVWKNAVAALRATALARLLVFYSAIAVGVLALAAHDARAAELATVVVTAWCVLLLVAGPLWVRFDLRHDLSRLAVLRALPLRGRDVVAAEIASSATALTVVQLALLAALVVVIATGNRATGAEPPLPLDELLPMALAAAIALPGINLASLTIQNAAALLYPAWVRPGGASRGVEAMGQNILSTGAALVVLGVVLAPPAAIAGALAWAAGDAAGAWALVPAAAVGTLAVVAELAPLVAWLGRVFDRTDPSALGGM